MQSIVSDLFTHGAALTNGSTRSNRIARRNFARLAWGALAYNVLVVLWGAFVRVSYAGDGCGSHWPLCNGEVIPADPTAKTLIEFSHRVTSGAALLLVMLLVWVARRSFPEGHAARRAVSWALLFTITEALIGAGLVVFGLVADDDSVARAASLAVHLVNTFVLLAALALAAWWATVADAGDDTTSVIGNTRGSLLFGSSSDTKNILLFGGALGGMLLLGASGAIAALGDTLFPSASLAHAWGEETSSTAHTLIRLRVLHPLIALVVSSLTVWAAWGAWRHGKHEDSAARSPHVVRLASAVVLLVFVQMLAGAVNVLLLAPAWMQILHLLLADLLWVAFVLLTAAFFAGRELHSTELSP